MESFGVQAKADHRRRNGRPSQTPVRAEFPMRLRLEPDIQSPRRDPEWEAIEKRMAAHTNQNLSPFEDC